MAVVTHAGLETAATRGLDRARQRLLALQHPDGWWQGELETNVTMDAEDLFLRHVLGILDARVAGPAAAWIRSQQRADGTWATFYGGPGDLDTTVEAYTALRLVGDPPQAQHLRSAAAFIRDAGGIARTRVFTRMWLALLGLWRWQQLPAVPPEVALLPPWMPLNLYDFACWARQTIAAIAVVFAHRPVRPVPFDLGHLFSAPPEPTPAGWRDWPGRLGLADRALHAYERRPLLGLRRRALAAAERWILQRQEADGSWGGIQPPWVWSLLALRCQGYALDHPVVAAGLAGLERFAIVEDGLRRMEACQSPVWDTALAVVALADAGLPADHPSLIRASDWLLGKEVTAPGDWAVRRPQLRPGGWSFEFANEHYPDLDDTAEVVLALRRVAHPDPARVEAAIGRALHWTLGMQCRDGGWAAFDVDNDRELARKLPFCDFGEVIDPPSADVTAHVVEMLCGEGRAGDPATRRAVAWLAGEQHSEGSWFGRWGTNHVYGTGAAVPALVAAGTEPTDPRIRKAVAWLERHQNPDGGWGEDIRSYRDPVWIGRGASTASQTAWALLALLAAGERSEAVDRGVAWLVDTQQTDGSWDEPWFTGTGFPWDFSINYHLYRLVFPTTALGRYLAQVR